MFVFEANVQNLFTQFRSGQEVLRNQYETDRKVQADKHQRDIVALKQAARISEQDSVQRSLDKAAKQESQLQDLKAQAEQRERQLEAGDQTHQAVLSLCA